MKNRIHFSSPRVSNQVETIDLQPKVALSSATMPDRDITEGEACCKESFSKTRRIPADIGILQRGCQNPLPPRKNRFQERWGVLQSVAIKDQTHPCERGSPAEEVSRFYVAMDLFGSQFAIC